MPQLCSHLHGPLARYVKLQVAHAPGMSGTFSLPLWISDPEIHYGTWVTRVPWCMPGSLTSGFLWCRWWKNVPCIPGACTTSNITYLVKGLLQTHTQNWKTMSLCILPHISYKCPVIFKYSQPKLYTKWYLTYMLHFRNAHVDLVWRKWHIITKWWRFPNMSRYEKTLSL